MHLHTDRIPFISHRPTKQTKRHEISLLKRMAVRQAIDMTDKANLTGLSAEFRPFSSVMTQAYPITHRSGTLPSL